MNQTEKIDDNEKLKPGDLIDSRYRVESILGEGGMGVVYKAYHQRTGEYYALKTLRSEYKNHREAVDRFAQEAMAPGKIGNPHICTVSDAGEIKDGELYLAMPLLDGKPFDVVLKDQENGQMPEDRVVRIINQLLFALDAAHANKIFHRDLKPENIFLVKDDKYSDFVKILDFGIAKVDSSESSQRAHTVCGFPMGTFFYMSPEQTLSAAEVDGRTDIYAVGIILYKALTGHLPFENVDKSDGFALRLLNAQQQESYLRPQEYKAGISLEMESVINKALRGDKDKRFSSVAEMYKALNKAHGEEKVLSESVTTPVRLADWDREGESVQDVDPLRKTSLSLDSLDSIFPLTRSKFTFQHMILVFFLLVAVIFLVFFLYDRFSGNTPRDTIDSDSNFDSIKTSAPATVLPETTVDTVAKKEIPKPAGAIEKQKHEDPDTTLAIEAKSERAEKRTSKKKRTSRRKPKPKPKPKPRPRPKPKPVQKSEPSLTENNGKQGEFSFPE